MIDYLLLAGRLVLVAILYLFLFVAMRTGIGLVKGRTKKQQAWNVRIEKGPKTLRGVRLSITGPFVVGRSPGSDIVIPTSYVSSRHARFSLMGTNLMIEDLDSTNGTTLNGKPVHEMTACKVGDIVGVGNVEMKIGRS